MTIVFLRHAMADLRKADGMRWRRSMPDMGGDLQATWSNTPLPTSRVTSGVEIETGVPLDDDCRHSSARVDCDFDTYLGNGEPLDEVTTLVPGRARAVR